MVRKNRKHGASQTTRVASPRQLTINFVRASLVLPIQDNPVLKDLLGLPHFRQQVEHQAALEIGIQAACLDWTAVTVTPPCKNMQFDGWKNAAEDTNTQPRVIIELKELPTPPLNEDQTPPPRTVPTESERELTMEERMNKLEADQGTTLGALAARVTVLVKELKANIAAQNDKILAQDDVNKELKAIITAQNDVNKELKANIIVQDYTIKELKANIIAQDDSIKELTAKDLAQGATIEKLEAKILAQDDTIQELKTANTEMRRQHTQEIDKLNAKLTESNEESDKTFTMLSDKIEKLEKDSKGQQKCIRVLIEAFRSTVI